MEFNNQVNLFCFKRFYRIASRPLESKMHPGQNRLLWPNRASTRLLNLNRMLCRTRKQYEHFKTLLRTRPTGNSNAFSKQITSHFDSNSNVILRESCLKSLMLTCKKLGVPPDGATIACGLPSTGYHQAVFVALVSCVRYFSLRIFILSLVVQMPTKSVWVVLIRMVAQP